MINCTSSILETSALWNPFLRELKEKTETRSKYLQIIILIKDLYPEYIFKSQKSTIRNETTKMEKWANNWKRHLTEGDLEMTNKHRKRCSSFLVINAN